MKNKSTSKIQDPKSNISRTKPLRVFILNWRDPFHPLAGGAELSLLEHVKYWQKKGAKITWFASSFEGAEQEETIDGITYIRRGSHFTVHFHFLLSNIQHRISNNYDVIIDSFHFLPFFTPLYIKNKKIIALINEVAGKVWFSNLPYPFSWIGYHVEPLFFKIYKNTPFITASESTKKDLLKVDVPENKIEIIPHGVTVVNVERRVKKEKEPTLLFLGRVSHDKGIAYVLSAYAQILDDRLKILGDEHKIENIKQKSNIQHPRPSIQLWVVGKEERPGMFREMLDDGTWKFEDPEGNILSSSNIQNPRFNIPFTASKIKDPTSKIQYFGFVSQEKKFELLRRSWLLLHASVKEGWGLTVIEAGSQETPTIGYDVEGLRDSIKNGKTGFLVSPKPHALADGVLQLLSDQKLYNNMGRMAKEWSNTFSWGKSGQKSWEYIKK